jgi:hypothetical protein
VVGTTDQGLITPDRRMVHRIAARAPRGIIGKVPRITPVGLMARGTIIQVCGAILKVCD